MKVYIDFYHPILLYNLTYPIKIIQLNTAMLQHLLRAKCIRSLQNINSYDNIYGLLTTCQALAKHMPTFNPHDNSVK